MSERRDGWASALLLHLLSDEKSDEGTSPSVSASEALVTQKTDELAHMMLNLQCTPVQERPSQAAQLEQRIAGIVKAIAAVDFTIESTQAAKARFKSKRNKRRKDEKPFGAHAQTGSAPETSEGYAISARTTSTPVRLSDKFHLNPADFNSGVNKYFVEHEAAASRAVYEASRESSNPIFPSHVVFAGVPDPISIVRLAAFTGPRFFGNLMYPHQPSTTDTSATPNTTTTKEPLESSTVAPNEVQAAGISPQAMDRLLQVIAGTAPSDWTLQQAGDLLEAMDYCLVVPELYEMAETWLQSMYSLRPAQTAWLYGRCLAHAPEVCLPISMPAHFVRPQSGAKIAAAADAAWRELAQVRRGIKQTLTLLALACVHDAPLWLRAGSLAAAAVTGELGHGCRGGCGGGHTCSHSAVAEDGGGDAPAVGVASALQLLRRGCVTDRELLTATAAAAACVHRACRKHVGLLEGVVKAACEAATQPRSGAAPEPGVTLPMVTAVLHGVCVNEAKMYGGVCLNLSPRRDDLAESGMSELALVRARKARQAALELAAFFDDVPQRPPFVQLGRPIEGSPQAQGGQLPWPEARLGLGNG